MSPELYERIERIVDRFQTQGQLAAEIGVKQQNVSQWIRGIAEPNLRTIIRLAWIDAQLHPVEESDAGLILVHAGQQRPVHPVWRDAIRDELGGFEIYAAAPQTVILDPKKIRDPIRLEQIREAFRNLSKELRVLFEQIKDESDESVQ